MAYISTNRHISGIYTIRSEDTTMLEQFYITKRMLIGSMLEQFHYLAKPDSKTERNLYLLSP
jgi:hypothetical protein